MEENCMCVFVIYDVIVKDDIRLEKALIDIIYQFSNIEKKNFFYF